MSFMGFAHYACHCLDFLAASMVHSSSCMGLILLAKAYKQQTPQITAQPDHAYKVLQAEHHGYAIGILPPKLTPANPEYVHLQLRRLLDDPRYKVQHLSI